MVNSDRLKETEIFQDLTYEEVDKDAVICILEDFQKGNTVILSREPAERLYTSGKRLRQPHLPQWPGNR